MPTERERFEKLANKSAYASDRGLLTVPLRRGGDDGGELISLRFAAVAEEEEPGEQTLAAVRFDVSGGSARYWQEYLLSNGNTTGMGYDLPNDFSESFEIGNPWKGTYVGDPWPQTEEFADAEGLIDFLARNLRQDLEGPPDR